jgi:hypothetical protein
MRVALPAAPTTSAAQAATAPNTDLDSPWSVPQKGRSTVRSVEDRELELVSRPGPPGAVRRP